ncbi:hypothetical protein [Actinomadura roseirufa]|uniref:hypothetical protein n=1 Tax=Actinomadura roseirufa TaxID=2094049 RepID=UPI001041711C|nr:hypothetical protein [Actinomadura roseirufa]
MSDRQDRHGSQDPDDEYSSRDAMTSAMYGEDEWDEGPPDSGHPSGQDPFGSGDDEVFLSGVEDMEERRPLRHGRSEEDPYEQDDLDEEPDALW